MRFRVVMTERQPRSCVVPDGIDAEHCGEARHQARQRAEHGYIMARFPRWMTPELSIVIPVRNESPNIKPLYDELTTTLERAGRSFEVIIIDDGSTDDTFEQLARLQSR